jgi:hypothetical protein
MLVTVLVVEIVIGVVGIAPLIAAFAGGRMQSEQLQYLSVAAGRTTLVVVDGIVVVLGALVVVAVFAILGFMGVACGETVSMAC